MSSTRRAFLAACSGAAAGLAGCTDVIAVGGSSPPVECGPTAYDWPTYGYDAARTGRAPARDLPGEDPEARRLSETGSSPGNGGSLDAPPVVADGVAYVAGDVRVEGRDVATGERVWHADPGDGVSVDTAPALGCGAVFAAGLNETVAFDLADGTELWRADAGGGREGPGSPTVVDDTVYVPGSGLTALDAESGEQRWSAGVDHSIQGVAVADRPYAGVGSNGEGGVVAFTMAGELWWQATDVGPVYSPPAVADGTVYAATKSGTVAALDAADGSVRWRASMPDAVYQPPAIADELVVVGAGNGERAVAFDAATGDRRWTFETGVSKAAPVVLGDRVLVAGANTGIWALDPATGEELWYSGDLGNVGSQPVAVDGALLYRAWNYSDVAVLS